MSLALWASFRGPYVAGEGWAPCVAILMGVAGVGVAGLVFWGPRPCAVGFVLRFLALWPWRGCPEDLELWAPRRAPRVVCLTLRALRCGLDVAGLALRALCCGPCVAGLALRALPCGSCLAGLALGCIPKSGPCY